MKHIVGEIKTAPLIPTEYKLDPDYIFNMLQESDDKLLLLNNIDISLFKNNVFCKKCIKYLTNNNYSIQIILLNCNKEIFDNFEYFMEVYEKIQSYDVETLLKRTKKEFLDSKSFILNVQKIKLFDYDFFKSIDNADLLVKLYECIEIYENLDILNDKLLNNLCLINYVLDNIPKDLYGLNANVLIENHKYNIQLMKKISSKFDEDYIDTFLKKADITDKNTILELASNNINFIKTLSHEEQLEYFKCVITDFTNVQFDKNEQTIYCENGKFNIIKYDELDEIDMIYHDLNHNMCLIEDVEEIFDVFLEEVSLRYPDKNLNEFAKLDIKEEAR